MLTAADIDHFRRQLGAQRDTLEQQIASLEQAMATPDQWEEAMQERGHDAVLLGDHDDDWDQLAFARDELAQVDKALAGIEAGTYGTSEVSGKPIPREQQWPAPRLRVAGRIHRGPRRDRRPELRPCAV